ncbi:MAG: OmpA family protein [Woeseiaceae bacterium]|nr:OmpA family protein [Woeseiaceae bacterium]
MNILNMNNARVSRMLAVAVAFSFAVGACATAPQSPQGSADVRNKLSALQANSSLASKVPVEMREAEAAVLIAEASVGNDVALGRHRVYMADQMVEIAIAKAATRVAEDQRAMLSQQRDQARLDARTREADAARRQATAAQNKSEAERALALAAAAKATSNEAEAAATAKELQQRIDALEAEATDRGLVLTLGDVLFATGRSDLMSGGNNSLDKLIVFLNEYPDRSVAIEGHTDDVGSLEMNQTLSQHRADAVKTYLTQHGIQSVRLASTGMGETQPIADNQSQSGRQQNRRVEVIIKNPSALPAASSN